MKKPIFLIKKWTARSLVAIGALLGLSSCGRTGVNPAEAVYGPPPGYNNTKVPEVIEDVYGPPIEEFDTVSAPEVVYGPPIEELDTTSVPKVVEPVKPKTRQNKK